MAPRVSIRLIRADTRQESHTVLQKIFQHNVCNNNDFIVTTAVTVTVTICGDAYPLSCVSAEAYKLAQCTRPQGWGS